MGRRNGGIVNWEMTKFGTLSGAALDGAMVTVGFEFVGTPLGARGGGGCIGLASTPPEFLPPCFLLWLRWCACPNDWFAFPLPPLAGGPPVGVPPLPPPDGPWGTTVTGGPVGPVGPVEPVGPVGPVGPVCGGGSG